MSNKYEIHEIVNMNGSVSISKYLMSKEDIKYYIQKNYDKVLYPIARSKLLFMVKIKKSFLGKQKQTIVNLAYV